MFLFVSNWRGFENSDRNDDVFETALVNLLPCLERDNIKIHTGKVDSGFNLNNCVSELIEWRLWLFLRMAEEEKFDIWKLAVGIVVVIFSWSV